MQLLEHSCIQRQDIFSVMREANHPPVFSPPFCTGRTLIGPKALMGVACNKPDLLLPSEASLWLKGKRLLIAQEGAGPWRPVFSHHWGKWASSCVVPVPQFRSTEPGQLHCGSLTFEAGKANAGCFRTCPLYLVSRTSTGLLGPSE